MKQTKKVQVFRAGLYQTVEVIGKYGKRLELPNQYTIVVIPKDFRQAQERLNEFFGKTRNTLQKFQDRRGLHDVLNKPEFRHDLAILMGMSGLLLHHLVSHRLANQRP